MRRLLIIAFLVAACQTGAIGPEVTPTSVAYWHDDAHRVSCWLFGRGGGNFTAAISCLPDKAIAP